MLCPFEIFGCNICLAFVFMEFASVSCGVNFHVLSIFCEGRRFWLLFWVFPVVYCKVISGVVLFLSHLSKVLIKASRICLAVFYRLEIQHFNLLPSHMLFASARVHSRFNFALLNKGFGCMSSIFSSACC
jgi:hypothetical protein